MPWASAIRINEIMPNPSDGCNDCTEWIEIYAQNENLTNYEINTTNEKTNFSAYIEDFLIITKNKTVFLNYWGISESKVIEWKGISLLNSGESIFLFDNLSTLISNVAYPSFSSHENKTYSLLSNSSWTICNEPSPGSVNSCQSQQNQTQNETNQTQQNQTQNTTEQNQTSQTNQSIPTIILAYPLEISWGESASIEIYAYNLDEATYDAKIYISDDGGVVISETYSFDEAKFKSSVYYVLGAFSGNSSRKNFTIRTKEESEFTGEANISVKLSKSGASSIYLEYSGKIKVVEAKSGSSNSSESIAKSADAGTGGNGSEEIIRLNTLATESKEDLEEAGKEGGILFMSKREMIKKYLIYAFAAFLVALIIVLFKYLRI